MKGLYIQARMKWQKQHGTQKFTSDHMNYVLVKKWRAFILYSVPVIINAFKKNILHPTPTHEDTNTQTCLTAAQTPKGNKAEEIEVIARIIIYPEYVVVTRKT